MAIPKRVSESLRRALGGEAAEDFVTWIDNVDTMRSDLSAMKAEVTALRGEFGEFRESIRADFAEFRHGVDKSIGDMREDIAEFKHGVDKSIGDMREDIAGFKRDVDKSISGVREEIARSHAELMRWSFVFWVGAVAAMAVLAGVLRQ
jgi:hypothetical protein